MQSLKCPQCGLVNFASAEECKRCKKPLKVETPPVIQAARPCAYCGGQLIRYSDYPHKSLGWVLIILGLASAPVLVGIPIAIVGGNLINKIEIVWICGTCGVKA